MNFVMTLVNQQSPWLSGRASERGIRRSGVQFLVGTQNLFFVPGTLVTERNPSFHISLPCSKLAIFLLLYDANSYSYGIKRVAMFIQSTPK